MLDLERILSEAEVSKDHFAEMLGIAPDGVNRVIKRLNRNYSEIEHVLNMIGYHDPIADLTEELLQSQQRTIEKLAEILVEMRATQK